MHHKQEVSDRLKQEIYLAKVQKEPSPPKYRAAGEGCSSKNKTLWSNTESPAGGKKRRKGTRNADDVNAMVLVKHM